jgi:hypothetical protein
VFKFLSSDFASANLMAIVGQCCIPPYVSDYSAIYGVLLLSKKSYPTGIMYLLTHICDCNLQISRMGLGEGLG